MQRGTRRVAQRREGAKETRRLGEVLNVLFLLYNLTYRDLETHIKLGDGCTLPNGENYQTQADGVTGHFNAMHQIVSVLSREKGTKIIA